MLQILSAIKTETLNATSIKEHNIVLQLESQSKISIRLCILF